MNEPKKSSLNQNERGITIIALVVTIIVLIILALIGINAIIDENGIIRKAEESKNGLEDLTQDQLTNFNELFEGMQEEEENAKYSLQIAERKETSFKAIMLGDDIKEYQFSIDGVNWTEKQDSPMYTFTDLTKTTVNSTNYKTTTGEEYTVYARATKKDTNETVTCNPKTAKLQVEVVADEYYFTYIDLGKEIRVTGRRELSEFDYIPEESAITIPSYINGKPVTQIDLSFFKLVKINELGTPNMKYSLIDSTNTVKQSGMIPFSDLINLSSNRYYTRSAIEVEQQVNSRIYVGIGDWFGISNNITMVDSITYDISLLLDPLQTVIIPPTVTKIVNNMSISELENRQRLAEMREKLNSDYKIQKMIDENFILMKIIFELNSSIVQFPDGSTGGTSDIGYQLHVKIIGKTAKEQLSNLDLIPKMLGYESNQCDYEIIN